MRPLIHHANPYFRRGGGSTFPKVAAVLQTTQLSTNNNDNNNKCHLPRLRIAWSKCNNSNIINNVIRYLLLRDLRGASRLLVSRTRKVCSNTFPRSVDRPCSSSSSNNNSNKRCSSSSSSGSRYPKRLCSRPRIYPWPLRKIDRRLICGAA